MFTCQDMNALLVGNKTDYGKIRQKKLSKNVGMTNKEIYSLFTEGDKLPWDISNFEGRNRGLYDNYTITTIAELKKSSYSSGPDDCVTVSAIKDGGIDKLWIRCDQDKDRNKTFNLEFSIQLMPKTGNKNYNMRKRFYKLDLTDFGQVKTAIKECIDKWNKEIGPEYLKRYKEKYENWSMDKETMDKMADDFYYTNKK